MTNPFINVLDKIGIDLKWFFTNPIAKEIEGTAVAVTEVAVPATIPLLTAIQGSVVTAQGLAAAANTTGDTTSQVVALVLSDAQQAFQEYEKSTGVTVEPAQAQQIVQLFLQLLQNLPAGKAATPVQAAAIAAVTSPQATTTTGTLL